MKTHFGSNWSNYVFERRKHILNLTEEFYAFWKRKHILKLIERNYAFRIGKHTLGVRLGLWVLFHETTGALMQKCHDEGVSADLGL